MQWGRLILSLKVGNLRHRRHNCLQEGDEWQSMLHVSHRHCTFSTTDTVNWQRRYLYDTYCDDGAEASNQQTPLHYHLVFLFYGSLDYLRSKKRRWAQG